MQKLKTLGLVLALLLPGGFLAAAPAGSLSLALPQGEGGKPNQRNLRELNRTLGEAGCLLQLVDDSVEAADLLFTSAGRASESPPFEGFQRLVNTTTFNRQPLTVGFLVHASTNVTDLSSLKGSRIAFVSDSSELGYHQPVALLRQVGATPVSDKRYFAKSYVGAMGLLLHRNVFAAAIPGPLAQRWAKANGLKLVAQSQPLAPGAIWIQAGLPPSINDACRQAFIGLERRSQRGMKVFPAWVEGFAAP